MLCATLSWIQIAVSLMLPDTCSLISSTCCLAADRWGGSGVGGVKTQRSALLSGLTRWGRLDLDLLSVVPSSHAAAAAAAAAVCRRLLAPLHLTLVGKQILDVLLLEGTGRAAWSADVQSGGQLTPLLVLVDLSGWGTGQRQDIKMTGTDLNEIVFFVTCRPIYSHASWYKHPHTCHFFDYGRLQPAEFNQK